MTECNSPNIYSNLNDQQQFRLNKISEVRDYFIVEIREIELKDLVNILLLLIILINI